MKQKTEVCAACKAVKPANGEYFRIANGKLDLEAEVEVIRDKMVGTKR